MNKSDYTRFCEIVVGLSELKGKQLSAPAVELYWHAMQEWSIADFTKAATHLLKSCAFMPTPKDFEDLRRANKPTATESWARVLQHCKGAYRDGAGIDNGGPIDKAVAGLGGYKAVAFHDLEYMPILQRQFVERFGETQDVAESRLALPPASDTLRLQ